VMMTGSLRRSVLGAWLLVCAVLGIAATSQAASADNTDGTEVEQQLQRVTALRRDGQLEQALSLLVPLSAANPRDFDVQWLFGISLVDAGRYAEAIENLEPVVQWLEGGGMDAAQGLRMLKLKLAEACYFRGWELQQEQHYPRALRRFEQAAAIHRQYRSEDLYWVLDRIADIHIGQRRYREAVTVLDEGLSLNTTQAGGETKSTGITLYKLGTAHFGLGDLATARRLLRRSLAILKQHHGADDPIVVQVRKDLALLQRAAPAASGEADPNPVAGPFVASVIGQLRREHGREPAKEALADALNDRVGRLFDDGKYKLGVGIGEQVLHFLEQEMGADAPPTLTSANNLALLHSRLGNYEQAERLYLRVLRASERALGKFHPAVLTIINNLAALDQDRGRYARAEARYLRAIAGSKKAQGKDHPNTLRAINNLADLYSTLARYREAERLFKTALEGRERALGPDAPDTLITLNGLARLYQRQRRDKEALALYQRVREVSERVRGKNHPETLVILNNLALLYKLGSRYDEAERLYLQVLAGYEGSFGGEHPNALTVANNLANLYQEQGRYPEAERLLVRVAEDLERTQGKDHPGTLTGVNNLALLFLHQGRYRDAEPLLLETLAGREQTLGRGHPATLDSINNLASLYQLTGRFREAEPLFLELLEVREQSQGREHPRTLQSLANLAGLYKAEGRYGEAEPLILRALEASERVLGSEHPTTLTQRHNLAGLYTRQGRNQQALVLYQQVLEVSARILGADHPLTLTVVNNLGSLYRRLGSDTDAEALLRRALAARERTLGDEHPDTLTSSNNLATLYLAQGRTSEAESLLQRVARVSERVLGRVHPDTAVTWNNLAKVHASQGRFKVAERLLLKALAVRERVLGDKHPHTLGVRENLVALYLRQGQTVQALEQLRLTEVGLRHWVETELANTLSQSTRRQLLQTRSQFQSIVFSLALRWPTTVHRDYAIDVLLRWKGVALEQEVRAVKLAWSNAETEVRQRMSALRGVRAELSFVANRVVSGTAARADREQRLAGLLARLNVLERELRRLTTGSGTATAALDVDAERLRSVMPARSALVELRLFRRFDFQAGKPGDLHLLALLLPGGDQDAPAPRLRDLGSWEALESEWRAVQAEVIGRDTKIESRGSHLKGLYQALFGVWDRDLATYTELFFAPDGALQMTALSALRLPDGRYWVERQQLHRLATGRELLVPPASRPGQGLIAFGGIDYDNHPAQEPMPRPRTLERGLPVAPTRIGIPTPNSSGFRSLKATGAEATAVTRLFRDAGWGPATTVLGSDAGEARLKALQHVPRVLHLATHGFFLAPRDDGIERPLTRSGLALAGANPGVNGGLSQNGEDGILYALEVSGLDLRGTELVTLSACDTGKGEVDLAEGVYGLVRAFRIAGAQQVLMTLWQVNDDLAQAFMIHFYRDWFSHPGSHPSEALRRTQLAFLNSDDARRRQPRHWAQYVLVESGRYPGSR